MPYNKIDRTIVVRMENYTSYRRRSPANYVTTSKAFKFERTYRI